MPYTIRDACPQCGAPLDVDENTRLIHCPYCSITNYLFEEDYFRYVIPPRADAEEFFLLPYMRFKGTIYSCTGTSITHKVLDITHRGFDGIPVIAPSLGLRAQAMPLSFLRRKENQILFPNRLSPSDVFSVAGLRSRSPSGSNFYHRAFIGEVISCIYLPLHVSGGMFVDAVSGKDVAPFRGDMVKGAMEEAPARPFSFLAAICPSCGWNLDGRSDSVVLTCSNCQKAWEAEKGGFINIDVFCVPSSRDDAVYLPFWRFSVKSKDGLLKSRADFVRLTARPSLVQDSWEKGDIFIWTPAFKIRPAIFLRLSKELTIPQRSFEMKGEFLPDNLYPVTLSRSEALQSIKTVLAASSSVSGKMFPLLPSLSMTLSNARLVYIPYIPSATELVQEISKTAIQRKTLQYGLFL